VEHPKSLLPVVELIEIFSIAKTQIHQAFIPQLPVEMAILKACGLQTEFVLEKAPAKVIKAKEKAEEKEEEEKKEEVSAADLDLERIRQDWPKVMQAIATPFIRVSFADAEPVKFEKGELYLSFKARSLMEKIENKVNQAQVQSAFQTVFHQKIKLKFDLKKLNLKPVAEGAEKSSPGLMEMAKEVFGG
ncbi:MAG: hypothetical protein V1908_02295, partial [Candidatus Peregrinibacteria bacterium]